jgi:hypothetical protein
VYADQKRVADLTSPNCRRHAFSLIVTQVVLGIYDAGLPPGLSGPSSDQPYIVISDLPKITNLKRQLPSLYVGNKRGPAAANFA